ncbi:hypothetical protein TELCIR_04775 [Teladorsagia circumcincta]|uniref:Enhancer of polycomb-like protein n=1 Tax=Teladorsagia circumcincta TaxID=45464 RepID=A0A2G9USL3_TELCI|nr:hypothetical protein TELCIR_04775 [Teladorsagia circumcincta]
MATTSKLSFRARNLDANKGMCVFFAAELPDLSECAPIARAVAQMPTGMEKEEEMESHLQDAILAQQASTSGVRVDNHVIPTPKVFPVDPKRYDEDQQGGVNPYVAFRRRAEKMQTRKNRKNDEDSYEKVLKLGHDLRKTVTLFDMVKRREKTKIALIDLDSEILAHRMGLLDFGSNIYNQFIAKIRESTKLSSSGVANGVAKSEDDALLKKKAKRRKIRTVAASVDRPVAFKGIITESFTASPCFLGSYRIRCPSQIPKSRHLYETYLPRCDGVIRRIGLARRRLGRGGRVLFDRFQCWDVPRVPNPSDPFSDDFLQNASVSFHARLHSRQDQSDVRPKRLPSWSRAAEEDCERRWLASGDNPSDAKSPEQDVGSDSNHMPIASISSNPPVTAQSGNGLAGRVDPSTLISTKEYGAVPASDEWREASGSPSESNSSTDWVSPPMATQIYPALSSEEEARTGDHPIAKQPPVNVKGSVVGATEIEYRSPFLLAPPTVGS